MLRVFSTSCESKLAVDESKMSQRIQAGVSLGQKITAGVIDYSSGTALGGTAKLSLAGWISASWRQRPAHRLAEQLMQQEQGRQQTNQTSVVFVVSC